MEYEELLDEIANEDIELVEDSLPGTLKAFYLDGFIAVDKKLTQRDKKCVLAEELAHHMLSTGDILDQSDANKRRQERRAREMAFEKLIPVHKFVDAFEYGCANAYEIADFFQVTEQFLLDAITYYTQKYGKRYEITPRVSIRFDPLGVMKRR